MSFCVFNKHGNMVAGHGPHFGAYLYPMIPHIISNKGYFPNPELATHKYNKIIVFFEKFIKMLKRVLAKEMINKNNKIT